MDPLIAVTAEQVSRLTRLSDHQLRYWDQTGFFSPSYADEKRRRPYSRIYRFRDVVGLRAISILRHIYRIPLQVLRKVGEWLKDHYEDPWSSLRFFVIGRGVFFEDPQTGHRLRPGSPPQAVLPIEMQAIEDEMRAQAVRLRERSPDEIGAIRRHRYVVSNAWVLAGTRVPTEAIWNFHAAGHNTDTILAAYPSLRPIDVQKAIEFEQQRHRKKQAG